MKITRFFILLGCLFLVGSCSGGGGGDETADRALSTNACSTLGLKARVVHGTACSESASPVVHITLLGADSRESQCTGSMITAQDVLTAAHCFLITKATKAAVVLGNDLVFGTTVAIHPDASIDPKTAQVTNDVAILHLERPVSLPTLPIVGSKQIDSGEIVAIFGYGYDDNRKLGTLRSGEMRISSVEGNFIVADFDGTGSNTCNGDSGGPALWTFSKDGQTLTGIVGLTSSGVLTSCAVGDQTRFANIHDSPIFDFIVSIVPSVGVI